MNANVPQNPFTGQWMIHIMELYYIKCQVLLIHDHIDSLCDYNLFFLTYRMVNSILASISRVGSKDILTNNKIFLLDKHKIFLEHSFDNKKDCFIEQHFGGDDLRQKETHEIPSPPHPHF